MQNICQRGSSQDVPRTADGRNGMLDAPGVVAAHAEVSCLCRGCEIFRLYFRLLCASAKLSRPDQGLKRFFSVSEQLRHFRCSSALGSEDIAIVAVKPCSFRNV